MRSRRGSAFVVAAFVALVGAAQSAAGPSTVTSGYTVGSLAVPGASTGLVLDGESVTVKTIGAKLTAIDAERDDQVVIRGDKSAQYELIVNVLSAVKSAGWNRVALATRAP